jgi:putative addiction module component (TIGR02574 family)
MVMTLPLETMTICDKLQMMETIWANLTQVPEEMPSPAWHRDVLTARMERVKKGESTYSDWVDVKARIRKAT